MVLITRGAVVESRHSRVQRILLEIRELGDTMQQHTDATSRRLGISTTEVRALNLVARRGAATPTELGQHLGVTSGGVTGIVDRLERSGHLRRTDDRHDRRKVQVEVNDTARTAAKETLGDLNRELTSILSKRSMAELGTIRDLLAEIDAAIAAHSASLDGLLPPRLETATTQLSGSGQASDLNEQSS